MPVLIPFFLLIVIAGYLFLAWRFWDNNPQSFMRPTTRKPAWWCPRCDFSIYGSKDKCSKCGTMRPAPKAVSAAVTAATATVPSVTFKEGDWICPRPQCKAHNFRSRSGCHKCGTIGPLPLPTLAPAPAATADADVDTAECVVCMDAKLEMIYPACGHICLCQKCATRVGRKCPVCSQESPPKRFFVVSKK